MPVCIADAGEVAASITPQNNRAPGSIRGAIHEKRYQPMTDGSNKKTTQQELDVTWVWFTKGAGEHASKHKLCRPVAPLRSAHNDTGGDCAREYSFTHKLTKKPVTVSVAENELYGPDRSRLSGRFAAAGLELHGYNPGAFADYLESLQSVSVTVHTNATGWRDGVYVTVKDTLVPSGHTGANVRYSGNAQPILATSGTLQEWFEGVVSLAAVSPCLMLALAVGFAGPATALVSKELGGGVCLYGESSRGKTSCAYAAASIYGKRASFIHKWKNTANFMLATLESHNDNFAVFDEFKTASRVELRDNPQFLIADGETPGRCNIHGEGKPKGHWTLQVFVTNERSMEAQMRQWKIEVINGASVRIPGVQVPFDKRGIFVTAASVEESASYVKHIERVTERCYGVAGAVWLQALVDRREELVSALIEHTERLAAAWSTDCDSQAIRGMRRFAFWAASLIVAREVLSFGTYFEQEDIELKIGELAKEWAGSLFSGGMSLSATKAIRSIHGALTSQGSRFARRLPNDVWTEPPNCLGFVRDDKEGVYFVWASALEELVGEVDVDVAKDALVEVGALAKRESKKVRGPREAKAYEIVFAPLEDGSVVPRFHPSQNAGNNEPGTGGTVEPPVAGTNDTRSDIGKAVA